MKPREKVILILFILTLLGSALAIGSDLYRKSRQVILEEKWQIELELAEMETLVAEASLWESRSNWLRANQPKFESRDAVDNHIFSIIKSSPPEVEVSKISLIAGDSSDHWIQAGVQVTAKSTLKSMFQWIHRLQSPDNFFVVEYLRVLPDPKELDRIICEFKLVRWYAPQD